MLLRHNKVDTVLIEDEEDLTEDKCKELVKQYKPARIVIEVNGMWDLVKLINETIPENWYCCADSFTTVNAETFSVYINNMKSLIMSHFQQSDLVIFNSLFIRYGQGIHASKCQSNQPQCPGFI